MSVQTHPEYTTPEPVCEEIPGMTKAKLAPLRLVAAKGPRYYKPTDRTVCYERSEALEWLQASAMQGTAERR